MIHILISLLILQSQPPTINAEKNDNAKARTTKTKTTIELREEEHEIGYTLGLILQYPPLYSTKSSYQQIEIYESEHYGKVFVLDECLQLTERDAPNYNEMLAHVPIMEFVGSRRRRRKRRNQNENENENDSENENNELLKNKVNVLVLGGGDGYVVSEVLKHPIVNRVDHCELDEGVIEVSQKFFPWAKNLWNQTTSSSTNASHDDGDDGNNNDNNDDNNKSEKTRVQLYVEDGAEFVKRKSQSIQKDNDKNNNNNNNTYHIIIQDSSDPFIMEDNGEMITLPSHVLYTQSHFENIYQILSQTNDGGVLIFQAETYNIPSNVEEIKKWKDLLIAIGFDHVRYGSIYTPTYSTGQIGFFVAHVTVGSTGTQSTGGEDNYSCSCSDNDNDNGTCMDKEYNNKSDKSNNDQGDNVVRCSEGARIASGDYEDDNKDDDNNDYLDYSKMETYFKSIEARTQYYYPQLHKSSFALPYWVHQFIYSKDP